jgi:hypothetical protein
MQVFGRRDMIEYCIGTTIYYELISSFISRSKIPLYTQDLNPHNLILYP